MNLTLFKWKIEFSTGLADLDAQHKIFMKYINLCHDAVTRDRLQGVPPDLVKKLRKHAEIHFSYEEQMMDFYGFPELENTRSCTDNLPMRSRNWKSLVWLEKARQT